MFYIPFTCEKFFWVLKYNKSIKRGSLLKIIEVKNLTYAYAKGKEVLKNLNIEIEKGEFVAIIGHNGSGKSTFAKLLNALFVPKEGEVLVGGLNTKDKNSVHEIRKKVGVVFQNPDNQLVASIVEDDVAFGPENIGAKREEIEERINFALDAVNMQEFRKRTPTKLSGGQKQRVAIAGVLAIKPEVLVLDESTAMLDPRGRREVIEIVKDLNKKGMTVILITHYMEEVVNADRVIVLSEGEKILEGTPKQIFAKKEELTRVGLSLPPATILADKLREKGVNIGEVLTPQELKEELCKLFVKI
ncbi:MAG: energy-coupling factor transporter ATPase [Clostridia bacterium]|nr:energy-coupling factor transporter ATPase [Clostridia bacterium]